MRRQSMGAGIALVALLQAPLAAQDGDGPTDLDGDPVEALLEVGAELELRPEQIRRLRLIQSDLEDRNRSLVDRLVEVQQRVQAQLTDIGGSDSRRPSSYHIEIALPPMRQIRANNREAMHEVRELLTRAQRRRAAELLLEGFEPPRRRRGQP